MNLHTINFVDDNRISINPDFVVRWEPYLEYTRIYLKGGTLIVVSEVYEEVCEMMNTYLYGGA